METKDLVKLKKDELFERARTMGLYVTRRMKKGEIIEAIESFLQSEEGESDSQDIATEQLIDESSGRQAPSSGTLTSSGAEKSKQVSVPAVPDLPEGYGKDRLTLLIRDPHWIFAYWEVTRGLVQTIRKKMGADLVSRSRLVLRFHDVSNVIFDGTNSHSSWDVEAGRLIGSRHVNVWGSDRDYIAELGYLTPNGTFIRLLLSNAVKVPSGKISDRVDEEWMIVEETYEDLLTASGMQRAPVSSEEVPRLMVRHVPGELTGLDLTLSSETLSSAGWGSETPARVAPDAVVASREQETSETDQIDLYVNSEVVFYGAATPGSTVYLNGQTIRTQSDGRFSIRIALEEGNHGFAFKAEKPGTDLAVTRSFNISRQSGE